MTTSDTADPSASGGLRTPALNGGRDCGLGDIQLDEETCQFYRQSIRALVDGGVPFLVGGGFALYTYTGISRHTKDLDLFTRPADAARALQAFSEAGFRTEMTDPLWLAKAFSGDSFVDLIFNSGNGVSPVDDEWFDKAAEAEVLGIKAGLCPPEEIIWSKCFVQERQRYDGADVAHYLRACAPSFDWERLLRRFGSNWRVLLSQLVLFGFIYPSDRDLIPAVVMAQLLSRLQDELTIGASDERICRGTLLSREQFEHDIARWGYHDARVLAMAKASGSEQGK